MIKTDEKFTCSETSTNVVDFSIDKDFTKPNGQNLTEIHSSQPPSTVTNYLPGIMLWATRTYNMEKQYQNAKTYFSVAVAVKPTNGTFGRTSRSLPNCLYSTLQKKWNLRMMIEEI